MSSATPDRTAPASSGGKTMAKNEEFKLKNYEGRMHGVVDNLKKEFGGLRTGRASAALLDPLVVDVYGQKMAINQVASVSVPEPRMIQVSVWDKSTVAAVERAIRDSSLGLNPVTDGTMLRLPIPPLTSERRQELAKIAGRYAENAKVAVRNVRRDANDHLKKLEKDGDMSQDEHKRAAAEVQTVTDRIIKEIDEL
ncbi:MAG: ribosome recycling factor, partial [Alphaproteobacteria bacterium]|nr:ribosome recycling factor [Alphaproteobacteria bacterium]